LDKLIFYSKQDANEYIKFMKEKGYKVGKPVKEKFPGYIPKAYDLNGKPLKFRWVIKYIQDPGKAGKRITDEQNKLLEQEFISTKEAAREQNGAITENILA
jgi:hypothetical protein